MPRNIEIKAVIASVDALLPRAAAIATEGPIEIEQDDGSATIWNSRWYSMRRSPLRSA
jgi:hypothetical protein